MNFLEFELNLPFLVISNKQQFKCVYGVTYALPHLSLSVYFSPHTPAIVPIFINYYGWCLVHGWNDLVIISSHIPCVKWNSSVPSKGRKRLAATSLRSSAVASYFPLRLPWLFTFQKNCIIVIHMYKIIHNMQNFWVYNEKLEVHFEIRKPKMVVFSARLLRVIVHGLKSTFKSSKTTLQVFLVGTSS